MDLPLAVLDEMDRVLREEDRARRRAQAKQRTKRRG